MENSRQNISHGKPLSESAVFTRPLPRIVKKHDKNHDETRLMWHAVPAAAEPILLKYHIGNGRLFNK